MSPRLIPNQQNRRVIRPVLFRLQTALAASLVLLLVACGGSFFIDGNTVVSIAISPSTPTVRVGQTEQFTATGTTANGNSRDVTASASWTSSRADVATIGASGLATALAVGTSAIAAKYQRGEGETAITASSGTLKSITLSPTSTSIAKGGTSQYTATGNFSDGSTSNITSSVTWASSNTGVASISSSGLATGIAGGSTTISATSGSIQAQTTLTVLN